MHSISIIQYKHIRPGTGCSGDLSYSRSAWQGGRIGSLLFVVWLIAWVSSSFVSFLLECGQGSRKSILKIYYLFVMGVFGAFKKCMEVLK